MGNDGQDLIAAFLQHFVHAHDAQEAVGVELFPDSVKENGQVVVVVQFFARNFPNNLVTDARVVNFNGQVATVVETTEFGLSNESLVLGMGLLETSTTGGIGLNYSLGLFELTQLPPVPAEVFCTLSA